MRLTRKQVIDAIDAVVAQGCLGQDADGNCLYANPSNPNINCVVGKLLTPKQRELADLTEVDSNIGWVNREHGFFDPEDVPLLVGLQAVHDLANDLDGFKKEVKKVVEEYFSE